MKLNIEEWTHTPETDATDSSGRSETYETSEQALAAYDAAMKLWAKRGKIITETNIPKFICIVTPTFWVTVEVSPF